MGVWRRLRLFFRRLFLGWDRSLTRSWQTFSRVLIRLFYGVWGWSRARNWLYLLQGIPAIAATATVIVLMVRWAGVPAQEIEARYQERAGGAAKAKDFPTALVCYERLAALGRDRPENLYELAVALEAQGERERAFEIMEQLAPVERNGHGPAHLWLGIHYWEGLGQPENRARAEAHLQRALQAGLPDIDAAHGLLGDLYAQTGRANLAEPHLERAVKTRPHLRLRYAMVLASQGKKARAGDEARLAANFFKTHAQADAANHGARLAWADAVTFLEDFPRALEILAEGHHLSKDSAFQASMSQVMAAWHFYAVRTQPDDVALQWSLLEKGLQLDSSNVRLLDRLVKLMGNSPEDGQRARAVMHKVLVKGEATATTHFLLGMDAWQQGDAAKAEMHWERANQMSPNLPMVANNLAWVLASAQNPDLKRALDLSQRVVEKYPNEPGYRDTRAHIYMKMGDWDKALPDLEWILINRPGFPTVHASLAEVYTQLGDAGLAAEYRRQAELRDKARKGASK
jgi:tetratricopeptide (TPR) repeat protein